MSTNFPGSLDSYTTRQDSVHNIASSDINNLQDAVMAIESKVGVGSYDYSFDTAVYSFIFSGQALWIYEESAPTGWTESDLADRLVATSGSGVYSVDGGNTSSGITWANLKAHTHSTAHTHSCDDHSHEWYDPQAASQPDHIFNSSGVATNITKGDGPKDAGEKSINVIQLNDNPGVVAIDIGSQESLYTQDDGAAASDAASSGTSGAQSNSDVRYPAAVGIIISKD